MSDTPICHRTIGPEFLSKVRDYGDGIESAIADPRPDPCRGSGCSLWVWAVREAKFSIDAVDLDRDPGAHGRVLGQPFPYDGCSAVEGARPDGTIDMGRVVWDPEARGWCADNLRSVPWTDPAASEGGG